MDWNVYKKNNEAMLKQLEEKNLSPFDLIPQEDIREKLVELVLNGVPEHADTRSSYLLRQCAANIEAADVSESKVVVFGGGTGLSKIIGGDSRQQQWRSAPFVGIKQIFPQTTAIVCVTDDGGSTGELLKDIPLIAIGDIRHVLLSSVQKQKLSATYGLREGECSMVAGELAAIFNYRFEGKPASIDHLLAATGADLDRIPQRITEYLRDILSVIYNDYGRCLERPQCLGNIIVISAILKEIRQVPGHRADKPDDTHKLLLQGLSRCAEIIGAEAESVLPCSLTPAQLRFLYTNGVEVSGEKKSSEARRGYPVERVFVDFSGTPFVSPRVVAKIEEADILIMAPGSLYSSIIPIFQIKEIAESVRRNRQALKLLIANLWVQAGETDKSITDPERKFHVSDMIRAYDRNLPGGTDGLFDQVLCLSFKDIPATVIQHYAVESKIPIYLDKGLLKQQGFDPVECGFYSKTALQERHVIQHDPDIVARTVKTLYLAKQLLKGKKTCRHALQTTPAAEIRSRLVSIPSVRFRRLEEKFADMIVTENGDSGFCLREDEIKQQLLSIVWEHKDIQVAHLDNIRGIDCVANKDWRRDQRWDNVFSYYDPEDGMVKIRQDRFQQKRNLEIAFLITVGQALLGNYAARKVIEKVGVDHYTPGNIFHLYLREPEGRKSFFNSDEIKEYLVLSRMVQQSELHFTRLINGEEGFTPPGLLMGIMYAWYLDNTFASHIEYKMSVLSVDQSNLIPEQRKMKKRREGLIAFFRTSVFGKPDQGGDSGQG